MAHVYYIVFVFFHELVLYSFISVISEAIFRNIVFAVLVMYARRKVL